MRDEDVRGVMQGLAEAQAMARGEAVPGLRHHVVAAVDGEAVATTPDIALDGPALEWLRAEIRLGVEELARGDYVEVDDDGLEEFLDRLATDPDL